MYEKMVFRPNAFAFSNRSAQYSFENPLGIHLAAKDLEWFAMKVEEVIIIVEGIHSSNLLGFGKTQGYCYGND